jgi:hypothetical protein
VDILVLLLLISTGMTSFQIVLNWQPMATDSRQLTLETKADSASLKGRYAFGLNLVSAGLLIFGIAHVFSDDIPGAMCGTGVLQAMDEKGSGLLLYRGIMLPLFYIWYEADKVNRSHCEMPLTEINARILLVILPVALWSFIESYTAFLGIHSHQPVNCCTVVYDQAASLVKVQGISRLEERWWVGLFVLASLWIALLGGMIHYAYERCRRLGKILVLSIMMWIPVAVTTLIDILAAYHYGVLHHHCPWCLFLFQHHLVGYILLGAMTILALEGIVLAVLPRLGKKYAFLVDTILVRCKKSGFRITCGAIVFLTVSVLPALMWRIKYGVWMSGGT